MELSQYFYLYAQYLRENGASVAEVEKATAAAGNAEICQEYFANSAFRKQLESYAFAKAV